MAPETPRQIPPESLEQNLCPACGLPKNEQDHSECKKSEEEIKYAKQGIVNCLSRGRFNDAVEIIDKFNLPDEEARKAIKQGIVNCLSRGGLWFDLSIKIIRRFNIPDEILTSPEMQEAAKQGIINSLLRGGLNRNGVEIIEKFNLPDEEARKAIKQGIAEGLLRGNFNKNVSRIMDKFNLPDEFLDSAEFSEAAKQGIINCLPRGRFSDAVEIIEKFNLPDEFLDSAEFSEAAKQGIINVLSSGELGRAVEIIEKFNLPDEILDSAEFSEAAKQGIIKVLSRGEFYHVAETIEKFNLPDEILTSPEMQEAAKQGVVNNLSGRYFDHVDINKIMDKFNLPEEIDIYLGHLTNYEKKVAEVWDIATVKELYFFYEENEDFFDYIERGVGAEMMLEKKDLGAIAKLNINYTEAEELKRSGVDLVELAENEDYEGLYNKLSANSGEWDDEQTIQKNFESGAEIFGYKDMFSYLGRTDISRHDSLHAFSSILSIQESSGIDKNAFYNQILEQVKKDSALYEEGTSYHVLNSIAQTLEERLLEERYIEQMKEKAGKYPEIKKLQELIASIHKVEDIFKSWSNLKKISELEQILQRAEILDELKELKQQGKEELYDYVENLAFHPSSKVNMSAVVKFWRNPEEFLQEYDEHTDDEVQERKKPSNYIEIPHLDLTATELRDALVEGKMDSIQAFSPLEITYSFPKPREGAEDGNLREKNKKALGSRRERIKGESKNPKKLFSELNKFFKKNGLDLKKYLSGEEELTPVLETQVEKILFDKKFGFLKRQDRISFVAKINKKSDPDAVLAGNDTACCMPFGSGKNTVYTFNPDTSLFTLQIKKPDGTLRTIAQSVLTKDKDVKKSVPDIISEIESAEADITKIIPEEALIEENAYLACDNVEVSPNFRNNSYAQIIEKIYRDFFANYMRRFAEEQKLHSEKVIIGQGYSDSISHLPQEKNTFVPLAPVAYSDKTHDNVYTLDLTNNDKKVRRKVKEVKREQKQEVDLPAIRGIEYLTFEDSLSVAYLESKAYSDNESLITYLHDMENGLIAKDINNAAKDRPNMSLKYVDDKGKIRGYMLAYEGKMDEDHEQADEEIIYISDLAADKKSRMAGGRLIKGFVDLYKRNYLDKNNFVPIYAEAREGTSYVIIQKELDRIGKKLGVEFELEELDAYNKGDDVMHPVIIRIKK